MWCFFVGNVVLVLNTNKIMEMKEYYRGSLADKMPPGSVFAAKTPSCTITAYKSGKVLFQGNDCEKEAGKWGGSGSVAAPAKKGAASSKAGNGLPAGFSEWSVIGSDEVGTGDFFGPITVVAAYVRKKDIPWLKEIGVRDSKDLTDEKIVEIAKTIKNVVPFSLMTLKNEKYNQVQQGGMSQGKMKALLHNQAILKVLEKIAPEKPDGILIDQFVQESTYFQHLRGQKAVARENVYFSTKAEGVHLAVAAASILARYAFIQYIDQMSEAAGFKIPKGAGAQVDEAAAKLIMKKGRNVLTSFVKLHFANTEKAAALVNKKKN
jgi:ribonuclease HIII